MLILNKERRVVILISGKVDFSHRKNITRDKEIIVIIMIKDAIRKGFGCKPKPKPNCLYTYQQS